MTSLRQIESNRRNAQRSTGPKTQGGKARSSQNAVSHGLTAETVIGPPEDPADYQAFEQAVTTAYDAETAVERELLLRLASLFEQPMATVPLSEWKSATIMRVSSLYGPQYTKQPGLITKVRIGGIH